MAKIKNAAEPLTRREREIMNVVFALGNRASAEEIRERLTNSPGDSAVRVMLARLERKGYLKHQQDGLRYIYSANISPTVAGRTALVAEASWTDEELDALQVEIDRVRKERKKQS